MNYSQAVSIINNFFSYKIINCLNELQFDKFKDFGISDLTIIDILSNYFLEPKLNYYFGDSYLELVVGKKFNLLDVINKFNTDNVFYEIRDNISIYLTNWEGALLNAEITTTFINTELIYEMVINKMFTNIDKYISADYKSSLTEENLELHNSLYNNQNIAMYGEEADLT